jgi:hypothetical protein
MRKLIFYSVLFISCLIGYFLLTDIPIFTVEMALLQMENNMTTSTFMSYIPIAKALVSCLGIVSLIKIVTYITTKGE